MSGDYSSDLPGQKNWRSLFLANVMMIVAECGVLGVSCVLRNTVESDSFHPSIVRTQTPLWSYLDGRIYVEPG
jgi:hypothetical protein